MTPSCKHIINFNISHDNSENYGGMLAMNLTLGMGQELSLLIRFSENGRLKIPTRIESSATILA